MGEGLKRNVLKLYTGLVRICDPGNRIYLFGFKPRCLHSAHPFAMRQVALQISSEGASWAKRLFDFAGRNSPDQSVTFAADQVCLSSAYDSHYAAVTIYISASGSRLALMPKDETGCFRVL